MTTMSENERRLWIAALARRLRRLARATCRAGPTLGDGTSPPRREPPAGTAKEDR